MGTVDFVVRNGCPTWGIGPLLASSSARPAAALRENTRLQRNGDLGLSRLDGVGRSGTKEVRTKRFDLQKIGFGTAENRPSKFYRQVPVKPKK